MVVAANNYIECFKNVLAKDDLYEHTDSQTTR